MVAANRGELSGRFFRTHVQLGDDMIDRLPDHRPVLRRVRQALLALSGLGLGGCATTGNPAGHAASAVSPAPTEIGTWSAAALAEAMSSGKLSSESIAYAYLTRIRDIDDAGPVLNAVIVTNPDALADARALDAERRSGRVRGPLHGVPVLIKDNVETAGAMATTAGSLALARNVTGRDAPLVARLRAAGAVILGKTNLSEWANFRSNESTSGWSGIGGLTRHAHAADRNPCGSSSGSGVAVAAGLAAAAIGTETDGSIVCPAGINGVVGLKPTVGLVSRTHVIPISASQDTAGPMTRTVRDAAILLTVLAGSDPADPATAEADARRQDYAAALDSVSDLRGVRIGVLKDRIGDNAEVAARFADALSALRSAGAELVEITDSRSGLDGMGDAEFAVLLSEFKAGLNAYLATTPASVATRTLADVIAFNEANAARELQHFDQDLLLAAEQAPGLDDPAYRDALARSRSLARGKIDALLRDHGVAMLAAPSNGPAWLTNLATGDSYSGPSQSALPAIAGYPHLTVPMGLAEGLPVGLSLIGPAWSEAMLLRAGHVHEMAARTALTARVAE